MIEREAYENTKTDKMQLTNGVDPEKAGTSNNQTAQADGCKQNAPNFHASAFAITRVERETGGMHAQNALCPMVNNSLRATHPSRDKIMQKPLVNNATQTMDLQFSFSLPISDISLSACSTLQNTTGSSPSTQSPFGKNWGDRKQKWSPPICSCSTPERGWSRFSAPHLLGEKHMKDLIMNKRVKL